MVLNSFLRRIDADFIIPQLFQVRYPAHRHQRTLHIKNLMRVVGVLQLVLHPAINNRHPDQT